MLVVLFHVVAKEKTSLLKASGNFSSNFTFTWYHSKKSDQMRVGLRYSFSAGDSGNKFQSSSTYMKKILYSTVLRS